MYLMMYAISMLFLSYNDFDYSIALIYWKTIGMSKLSTGIVNRDQIVFYP